MNFWINLWTIVLVAGIGIFAVLAIVVSIGGFFDIRELFKTLNSQHKNNKEDRCD